MDIEACNDQHAFDQLIGFTIECISADGLQSLHIRSIPLNVNFDDVFVQRLIANVGRLVLGDLEHVQNIRFEQQFRLLQTFQKSTWNIEMPQFRINEIDLPFYFDGNIFGQERLDFTKKPNAFSDTNSWQKSLFLISKQQ